VKLRHTEYVVVSEDCSQILDIPPISPSELSQNDENCPTTTPETASINSNSKLIVLYFCLL
jgi:hypothetical protein